MTHCTTEQDSADWERALIKAKSIFSDLIIHGFVVEILNQEWYVIFILSGKDTSPKSLEVRNLQWVLQEKKDSKATYIKDCQVPKENRKSFEN